MARFSTRGCTGSFIGSVGCCPASFMMVPLLREAPQGMPFEAAEFLMD